jgi:hypothetical protein
VTALPKALRVPQLQDPDRDFDAAREVALGVVTDLAGPTWTDHNLPDPGITMLEALAWGIAELHYRTERRGLADWPFDVPSWRSRERRHWSGVPLPGDPEVLLGLAGLLAQPGAGTGTVAEDMAAAVADATSVAEAAGALVDLDFAGRRLTWDEAAAVARLLRLPDLLRAALDRSDRVSEALERSGGDAEATLALLRRDLLFESVADEDLRAIVRRELSSRLAARVHALRDEIRALAGGPGDTAALLARLISDSVGLDAAEADQALALSPCPPGIQPEFWEATGGATEVWPPHALQARTCEPVTAEDYARRARTAAGVRRAWAVAGVLPGVGWDGAVVADADDRPGAVTLLVEPDPPVPAAGEADFLRRVLRTALGGATGAAEVDDPFDTWRNTLDAEAPRRLLGDEVGAGLVRQCPVIVKATLHAPAGSDRQRVIDAARERVAKHFRDGRPESRPPAVAHPPCPAGIEGPWPYVPQPTDGWNPGEAIRLNELVQVLADDPAVLGVEGLQLALGGGEWLPAAGDPAEVALPPECLPVLAERRCLDVRLALAAECSGG